MRSGRLGAILILCLSISCSRRGPNEPVPEGYWWPEEPLSAAEKRQEAELKTGRVQEFLRRQQISGLLIGRPENFAWITGGARSRGRACLFFRDDGRKFLISGEDQIRWMSSESLRDLGYEARAIPWYREDDDLGPVLSAVADLRGGVIGSDLSVPGTRMVDSAVRALRYPLTAAEISKYRWLGKTCADAVSRLAREIQPGMTERGIEAMVEAALARHAIRPIEVLIAADERISRFRNAPASDTKKLERFVRIRIRAGRWGINVGLTRLIHFGPVPRDVQNRLEAAARVCAGFWARTLPGASSNSVLQGAIADYAEVGFPDEWKASTQGGAIGYGGWDWLAMPGSQQRLVEGQVFDWYPAIQGVCVEDTILVTAENLENLTQASAWPVIEARALGRIYRLPGILVR